MGRKRNNHLRARRPVQLKSVDNAIRNCADIIPADCWIYMARNFLPYRTIINLSVTSHSMKDVMFSNSIWKHLVEQHFGVEWQEMNTRREREPIIQDLDREGRFVEVYRHLLSLQASLIETDDPEAVTDAPNSATTDFLFKILLTGDAYTGKTTLLTRFATGKFEYNIYNTIGIDFRVVRAKTRHGTPKALRGKLQVWDQAGRERFRTLTRAYYRNAHAFLVLFALNDRRSFEVVQQWHEEIVRNTDEQQKGRPVIVLVGTKADLVEKRQVSEEEARELAKRLDVPYIETSAKTGEGVSKAFCTAASLALRKHWQSFFENSPRDSRAVQTAENQSAGGILSTISNYFKSLLGW